MRSWWFVLLWVLCKLAKRLSLTLTGSQKSFSRKTSVCEAVQHLANEKRPSFVGLSPPKHGNEEEKVAWSSFDLSLCGGFSVDNTLQGTHCSSHNL